MFVTTIFFCVRHDNFLLCCVRLCDFLLCLSLQFFDVFVAVSFYCGRHCECEVCCGVTVNYVCGYTDNVVHLVVNWGVDIGVMVVVCGWSDGNMDIESRCLAGL